MAYAVVMFCKLFAMGQGAEIVDSQMELRGYMAMGKQVLTLTYIHAIHSRM